MSMDDNDRNSRMKQFVDQLDPNITKFQPKGPTTDTIASTINNIREHAKRVITMCDTMDKIIAETDGDAREAADKLLELLRKVK